MWYYINDTHNNWISLLSMAQLTLNAKVLNITKITSFFVNYNIELNLFERERKHILITATMQWIKKMKIIRDNIVNMQQKSTKYQNTKRKMILQLKKGDKIFLLTKNLKTRKSNKKLNHVKVESFLIKELRRSINYELNLPKNVKIHLIFHISLLKLIDFNTSI